MIWGASSITLFKRTTTAVVPIPIFVLNYPHEDN